MSNAINWFELFVADMDRACRFYESTLAIRLRREDFDGKPMAIFPASETGVGGALVRDAHQAPAAAGTRVYLNANGKLDACLERVVRAGGAVELPKTDIGAPGFIAMVRDSEGNLIGLHSERA